MSKTKQKESSQPELLLFPYMSMLLELVHLSDMLLVVIKDDVVMIVKLLLFLLLLLLCLMAARVFQVLKPEQQNNTRTYLRSLTLLVRTCWNR